MDVISLTLEGAYLVLRGIGGDIVGAMPRASVCMHLGPAGHNVVYLSTFGSNRQYPERNYVVWPQAIVEPAGPWNANSLLQWLVSSVPVVPTVPVVKSFKAFSFGYESTPATFPVLKQAYAMLALRLGAGSSTEVHLKPSSLAVFTNDVLAWYVVSGAAITGLLNSHFAPVPGSQVQAAKLGAAFTVSSKGLIRASGYAVKNSVSTYLDGLDITLSNGGTSADVFALVIESQGSNASIASTINWIESV